MNSRRLALAGVALWALQGQADGAPDRDTLRAFEARLDSVDSATAALRSWCAERRLADPPTIRAERDPAADPPADPRIRRWLEAAAGEPIRYRHVRLLCGRHLLSVADNWYRPNILTEDMNRRLDQTDAPFGAVVEPLRFHRRRLGVQWLLGRPGAPEGGVLRHRALLVTGAGVPFSLVVETYTAEVLREGPGSPAN